MRINKEARLLRKDLRKRFTTNEIPDEFGEGTSEYEDTELEIVNELVSDFKLDQIKDIINNCIEPNDEPFLFTDNICDFDEYNGKQFIISKFYVYIKRPKKSSHQLMSIKFLLLQFNNIVDKKYFYNKVSDDILEYLRLIFPDIDKKIEEELQEIKEHSLFRI